MTQLSLIYILKGHKRIVFYFHENRFLVNSAGPYEMLAPHLGFHCLPKYIVSIYGYPDYKESI